MKQQRKRQRPPRPRPPYPKRAGKARRNARARRLNADAGIVDLWFLLGYR